MPIDIQLESLDMSDPGLRIENDPLGDQRILSLPVSNHFALARFFSALLDASTPYTGVSIDFPHECELLVILHCAGSQRTVVMRHGLASLPPEEIRTFIGLAHPPTRHEVYAEVINPRKHGEEPDAWPDSRRGIIHRQNASLLVQWLRGTHDVHGESVEQENSKLPSSPPDAEGGLLVVPPAALCSWKRRPAP